MGFLEIIKRKPIPYEIYSLKQVMGFMDKYGEIYDFPQNENGFMAVPKREIDKKIAEARQQSKKSNSYREIFENNISNNGKFKGRDINIGTYTSKKQYGNIQYAEGKKYGNYQSAKRYQESIGR